jgi:hypothetical protein
MSDQYSPDSEYFIRYEIDEPTYERQSSLAAESTVVIFGKDLGMTKKQLISISLLAAGYFFIWCYFALFAPFFPHEAMKKGQSSSHIGAIFGVYQLVLLIGCPIFGKYVIYKLIVIIIIFIILIIHIKYVYNYILVKCHWR